MNGNKKIRDFFALCAGTIIILLLVANRGHCDAKRNILEHMKNGLEDSVINDFYQQEIEEVQKSELGKIKIEYYDVDLNDDGRTDKIITMRSALHSGTHGDAFRILFDAGNCYEELCYFTIRLYDQSDGNAMGQVYILEETSNGFHDVKIVTDNGEFILRYEDGDYCNEERIDDEKEGKRLERNPLEQSINQTDDFSELEQAYEEECALTNGITVEMIEVTQRFTESWKAEVEKYEMLILEKLDDSNKERFEETQEAWSTYSDENVQMIWTINEQVYEGGSYLNILEADLAYQKYHDRAIELRELYELLEMR